MRVRATERGYYGSQIREAGDVFEISDPSHFGTTWMQRVRDPLDHDGDGKRGGSLPRAPQVSTETTVTPPSDEPKKSDTI